MADFSKINVKGVSYNVKDTEARETANTAQSAANAATTAATAAQTTANKVYDIGAEYESSTETITFTFVEES